MLRRNLPPLRKKAIKRVNLPSNILVSITGTCDGTSPACRISGLRSHIRCELPPDHIVGRNTEPRHEPYHYGRGASGRWFSWPQEVAT